MKRLYILSTALIISASAFAQRTGTTIPVKFKSETNTLSSAPLMSTDTIYPISFADPCFTGDQEPLVIHWAGSSIGYITGTNSYGDLEKAQKYYVSGSKKIHAVWVNTAWATSATSSNTSAKVYNINAVTKGPGVLAGTSETKPMDSITTNMNIYSFTSPVSVQDEFAVSAVLPQAAGDTLVISATRHDCYSIDSLAWEKWSNGTWLNMENGWQTTTPQGPEGLRADLAIFPIVELVAGTDEFIRGKGLTLLAAAPSPATNEINVRYEINRAQEVSVMIYDLNGRLVTSTEELKSAGAHATKVDLSNIASGAYIYSVKTESAQLMSRFVVTK